LPLRVYVPDLSVLLFDDDPVLELLLLPLIVSAALDKQASGLDAREQATPAATAPKSAFPILEPPLEELELLDELELNRLATANDDGTETRLRTLLKIADGVLVLSLFDFAYAIMVSTPDQNCTERRRESAPFGWIWPE
jgi:hypothetical protein